MPGPWDLLLRGILRLGSPNSSSGASYLPMVLHEWHTCLPIYASQQEMSPTMLEEVVDMKRSEERLSSGNPMNYDVLTLLNVKPQTMPVIAVSKGMVLTLPGPILMELLQEVAMVQGCWDEIQAPSSGEVTSELMSLYVGRELRD